MNRYKFPSPATEPNIAVDEYDSIMRTARRVQYEYDGLGRNDLNSLAGALCYLREKNAWLIWPKEAPVRSPHKFIELVTGEPADKVIDAIYTLSKNGVWHRISWLMDEAETDEVELEKKFVQVNPDKTNAELAEAIGKSVRTVQYRRNGGDAKNSVITEKVAPPRKQIGYRITTYTKPETAAEKIRKTFGDAFAKQLKELL